MESVITDPTSSPIEIERATTPDEIRSLIAELDQELAEQYPPEQRHGLSLDAIFQPHVRFFVARINGAAVGCGGIALYSGFAEVKRMYVRKERRGQGVADSILARLEEETLAAGLSVLRLETGDRQVAAIRFYRRNGFVLCDIFEPYSSKPPETVVASVFLEKQLSSAERLAAI